MSLWWELRGEFGIGAKTYMIPMPKIPLTRSFLFKLICSRHTTGIGRMTTATSISKLEMPMYMSNAF